MERVLWESLGAGCALWIHRYTGFIEGGRYLGFVVGFVVGSPKSTSMTAV